MKIYHHNTTKEVDWVFYDHEQFLSLFDGGGGYTAMEIDEIPANKSLCSDLHYTARKRDVNGLSKYYIDQDGDLAERDGWVEAPPEEL